MKKIILVGYMASGKTEIGKLLAKKTDLPFFDIDYIIENELHKTISEIFDDEGEIYFRKKEHEVFIKKIKENQSFILSLGGGTPCYANNHEYLQSDDIMSIYLKANIETLTERLKIDKSKRPLIKDLTDLALSEFVAKHLFDRSYYYNQCKYTIVTDNKSPTDIVEEIFKTLL